MRVWLFMKENTIVISKIKGLPFNKYSNGNVLPRDGEIFKRKKKKKKILARPHRHSNITRVYKPQTDIWCNFSVRDIKSRRCAKPGMLVHLNLALVLGACLKVTCHCSR